MRIFLLVLLFAIWEMASPSTAQGRWLPASQGVPLFFSGYMALILIVGLWGRRLAAGIIHGDPGKAIDRFNYGLAGARVLIPAWFAVGVFYLGWKHAVDLVTGPLARWPVTAPSTFVGLLPGFFAWAGLWWSQFPVDRALREQNVLFQLESDLPVFAAPTFGEYFRNKLRVQLLFSVVPLLLILCIRDAAALGISALSHTATGRQWGVHYPLGDNAETILSFGSVFVVLLLAPELLRHVLHTQRLPESDLRTQLSAICNKAGIGCREILLWHTQNNMGNAAVMGLIPQVRYVMLSDLLLESMTDQQIQAVFAHELGHVKHRHLFWFVMFFLSVSSALSAAVGLLESHLKLSESHEQIFNNGSMVIIGALLLVGYGFLSRWFERQADVYAARTLEKSEHKLPSAEQQPGSDSGAMIFASALHRVAVVNNIPIHARNWTHGSIQARMRYIKKLDRDPQVSAQFDRTGRWVLAGMITLILSCAALAIYGARVG